MTNLAAVISQAQHMNEKKLAAELGAFQQEQMATDALVHLRRFHAFAKARGIRFCPCTPAAVAAYVRAEVAEEIRAEDILEALAAIEAVHDQGAVANPVFTAIVRREIAQIPGLIESKPRSWRKEERPDFWLLPNGVRRTIIRLDIAASKAIRQAQNEVAELRHKLKSFEQEKLSNVEVSSE